MTSSLFNGLSAFPITPADPKGHVDTQALCGLIERLKDAGVDSIGLLGSTGTYPFLSRTERRRAIETAACVLKGSVPLIVGIGALRTDEAEDLARDAQEAGADGGLLAPVSYTPLTEEEVFQHFAAVAQASSLPLAIYNNPGTTHFSFSDALLERLASVPRIEALKYPAPPAAEAKARHAALRAGLGADFSIGYSGDWNVRPTLLAGGDAWYSVIAGLLPIPALRLHRAAKAGDAAEAARLDTELEPLWALFRELGSIRVVHAGANILGLSRHAPPRPILPLKAEDRARVAAVLERLEPDRFRLNRSEP